MFDFLQPEYGFFLVSILVFFGFLLVFMLSSFRYHARVQADATALARERLAAQIALKRELIQRGLSPQELEQAVKLLKLDEEPAPKPAPPLPRSHEGKSDQQLVAEVAAWLAGQDGVAAEDLEQVLGLVRDADRETKIAALDLLENIAAAAETDLVLASVRSLCQPAAKTRPPADGMPLELSSHITR
jgi:hypothetical protein